MRRRATSGNAHVAEIGGGPASGGPRRGFRRPRRDRGDRPSRGVHVLGTCRQTSGEAAPQQSVAGERDQHQDWPAESSLQQVKKKNLCVSNLKRIMIEGKSTSARVPRVSSGDEKRARTCTIISLILL